MATSEVAGEDLAIRRRRLRYRAWHRGTRELDLLIGPFVDAFAGVMNDTDLDHLERFLDAPETDLQVWLTGQGEPAAADRALVERIISFKLSNATT